MTAHKLPPAAIHRHTRVSCGPSVKAKAARVPTVIAALAITSQDSSRIKILTWPSSRRSAPVRPVSPGVGALASRRAGDIEAF